MYRPKRTRKDKNHRRIVEKCREKGMVVWDVADLGGKVLDIIVFWQGKALPVEIKSKGNAENLTEGEIEGISELEEVGMPYVIATKAEDIISAFLEKEEK
jgi:hypothetical protein